MISFTWISDNFTKVIQIITLIVVAGELITRLTPTKTDDGFMRRVGTHLDRLLTMLRVPNLRKKIEEGSRLDTPSDGVDSDGSLYPDSRSSDRPKESE